LQSSPTNGDPQILDLHEMQCQQTQ